MGHNGVARAGVIVAIEVALTVAIGQAGCAFTPAGGGGIGLIVVVALLRWRLGPDGPVEEHHDDAKATPASS